jgi:hypothetical protein
MAMQFCFEVIKAVPLGFSRVVRCFERSSESWISLFVAACCILELIVCNPPSPFRDACLAKVSPLLDYISLLPRFNMFSPDPPRTNWSIWADITFADGTTRSWRYPELSDYKSDFWLPQVKVRYQYWRAYTSVGRKWPLLSYGCAIQAARLNYNPANPPKRVKLYLLSKDILLPGENQEKAPVRTELEDYIVSERDL